MVLGLPHFKKANVLIILEANPNEQANPKWIDPHFG